MKYSGVCGQGPSLSVCVCVCLPPSPSLLPAPLMPHTCLQSTHHISRSAHLLLISSSAGSISDLALHRLIRVGWFFSSMCPRIINHWLAFLSVWVPASSQPTATPASQLTNVSTSPYFFVCVVHLGLNCKTITVIKVLISMYNGNSFCSTDQFHIVLTRWDKKRQGFLMDKENTLAWWLH